jgi:hypothetical protein
MGSVAYVELALYALPEEKAVSIKDDWKARLAKLFPRRKHRSYRRLDWQRQNLTSGLEQKKARLSFAAKTANDGILKARF